MVDSYHNDGYGGKVDALSQWDKGLRKPPLGQLFVKPSAALVLMNSIDYDGVGGVFLVDLLASSFWWSFG